MDGAIPFHVPDQNRSGALLPPRGLRLPPQVGAAIDTHAARLGCSSAALTRALVAQGVAQLREALPG
jgi:hypothetical protein